MMLSRIGLIGDVHAADNNLEVALHFLAAQDVSKVLCTGDVVDGAGDADRCCALLHEHEVETVRGNHDRWLLTGRTMQFPLGTPNITCWEELASTARDFMKALPVVRSYETVAGRLLLCHGVGENDMQMLRSDDDAYALQWKDELHDLLRENQFRWMIGGHTHQRMVRHFSSRFGSGLTVINAGTLTPDRAPCLSIVDFSSRQVQFWNITDGALECGETLVL